MGWDELHLRVLPDRLNDAGSTPSRPFSCFLMRWACRLDCNSDSSVNGVGSIKLAHSLSSGSSYGFNYRLPLPFRLELLTSLHLLLYFENVLVLDLSRFPSYQHCCLFNKVARSSLFMNTFIQYSGHPELIDRALQIYDMTL